MESESLPDQIIEGLSGTAKGLEDGEINRCPNCNHIYDKRNPPRVVTRSIARRLMAQAGFAAGPWQDGEPPKDGECWDGWWECFPFERFTIRWCDHRNEWVLRGSGLGIDPPDKHVKINLPSAE